MARLRHGSLCACLMGANYPPHSKPQWSLSLVSAISSGAVPHSLLSPYPRISPDVETRVRRPDERTAENMPHTNCGAVVDFFPGPRNNLKSSSQRMLPSSRIGSSPRISEYLYTSGCRHQIYNGLRTPRTRTAETRDRLDHVSWRPPTKHGFWNPPSLGLRTRM